MVNGEVERAKMPPEKWPNCPITPELRDFFFLSVHVLFYKNLQAGWWQKYMEVCRRHASSFVVWNNFCLIETISLSTVSQLSSLQLPEVIKSKYLIKLLQLTEIKIRWDQAGTARGFLSGIQCIYPIFSSWLQIWCHQLWGCSDSPDCQKSSFGILVCRWLISSALTYTYTFWLLT